MPRHTLRNPTIPLPTTIKGKGLRRPLLPAARNLLGNRYDTGVAASRLIFGGVLDRFTTLEFVLPHAGGAFPWLVGRMDQGVRVRPELKHEAAGERHI